MDRVVQKAKIQTLMLKNLKSLFVKEEGKTKKEPSEDPLKNKKVEAAAEDLSESSDYLSSQTGGDENSEEQIVPSIEKETPRTTTADTKGEISDKFMDILLGAMKKNNKEGFDYMEYKQSLQSLKKMDMEDATRFQSAFAMAQTMGATKENITSSASYYLDILNQEKQKFQQVVASQNTKQVTSKQTGSEDILKAIANKEQQIKKLQDDIAKLKEQYASAKKEIEISKTKVEKTKNDFLITYDLLESQIKKDVELIKKYLQ